MSKRPKISFPIPISGLEVKQVKPLALRDKDLPPTPDSERVVALERENEMLQRDIRTLKCQIDIQAHQINHYRQMTHSAKSFAKSVSLGIRHLQDATFTMKKMERQAQDEWKTYQNALEKHMERTGTIENVI